MTEQYRPDEVIQVISDGLRVVRTSHHPEFGRLLIVEGRMADGSCREGAIALDVVGTTVKRVTPAEGPPRPGQLWGDRLGREWFALLPSPASGSAVRLTSPEGRWENWRELHTDPEVGPLTLLRDVPPPVDAGEES